MRKSARRSLLFAPAHHPGLFAKAVAKGADIVCIECEDAVPAHKKAEARAEMIRLLSSPSPERDTGYERIVRINALDTEEGQADLQAICTHKLAPDAILLPKIDTAGQLSGVADRLEAAGVRCELMALIETALGLEHVADIATSTDRLSLLLFGGVDLSCELGCEMSWMALLYARQRTIHAAALASLDVLDMPHVNISSLHEVAEEAAKAREIGFTGKAAIHPAQLESIHQAFSPTQQQIQNAQDIITACNKAEGGAALFDGKLIEKPVQAQAQSVLDKAHMLGLI